MDKKKYNIVQFIIWTLFFLFILGLLLFGVFFIQDNGSSSSLTPGMLLLWGSSSIIPV